MKMKVSDWEVVQNAIPEYIPTFEGAMFEALIERRTYGKTYSSAVAISVPKELIPPLLKIMSDKGLEQFITEWVTRPDGTKKKVERRIVPRVP